MNMRQDALCAAAAFVLATEKWAWAEREKLVATVGTLQISDAASNVIPGEVTCSLDLRSADNVLLEQVYTTLQQIIATICEQRRVSFEWELIQQTAPVTCDRKLNHMLAQSIIQSGYPVISLVSGAGHDAVPVSAVSPVCMLFVRCYKGISHHPLEDVEIADIAAAVKVSDHFIHRLIEVYNQ
jgi:allantoate deiminase